VILVYKKNPEHFRQGSRAKSWWGSQGANPPEAPGIQAF